MMSVRNCGWYRDWWRECCLVSQCRKLWVVQRLVIWVLFGESVLEAVGGTEMWFWMISPFLPTSFLLSFLHTNRSLLWLWTCSGLAMHLNEQSFIFSFPRSFFSSFVPSTLSFFILSSFLPFFPPSFVYDHFVGHEFIRGHPYIQLELLFSHAFAYLWMVQNVSRVAFIYN